MVEIYTQFQTIKVKKNTPFGAAHTFITYIREYPPPPPGNKQWITTSPISCQVNLLQNVVI